jgi:membrane fusion protein, multidrug efflux system
MSDTSTSGSKVPQNAGFRAPRGFPTGPALAVLLSVGLIVWMNSGAPDASPAAPEATQVAADAQSVRVVASVASDVTRQIMAEGDTRALRRGNVTARISGVVSDIVSPRGSVVAAGDPILRLEVPGFEARLEEAEARVAEAERGLRNALSLGDRGLATEDRVAAARTALASAEAGLRVVTEEQADMVLRAPFAGILNTVGAEIGDNLSPGTPVAEILDTSSLIVRVTIPQNDIAVLDLGQTVQVSLVTGHQAEGTITFISAAAEAATRSFPVEITVPNPDGTLRAGVSTTARMDADVHRTHAIATAYLSLDEAGTLMVKTVEDGFVQSYPVSIVASGLEEVRVTGLPDEAMIITVGQGFVRAGDPVRADMEPAAAPGTAIGGNAAVDGIGADPVRAEVAQ